MPESPKKVVYIAGPISYGNLQNNIVQADSAFVELVRAGFAPINPMWSAYAGGAAKGVYFKDDNVIVARGSVNSSLPLTHADWLGLDLPVVERCDAVLRLPGDSSGADREVAHAKEHGVPVFDSVAALVRHFAPKPDHVLQAGNWVKQDVGEKRVSACPTLDHYYARDWAAVKPGQRVRIDVVGKPSTVSVVEEKWSGALNQAPASLFVGTDGYEALVERRRKFEPTYGVVFTAAAEYHLFRHRRVA